MWSEWQAARRPCYCRFFLGRGLDMLDVRPRTRAKAAAGDERNMDEEGIALTVLSK